MFSHFLNETRPLRFVPLLLLVLSASNARALSTEISTVSPTLQNLNAAKPNLMFILDDSGSMTWDFTPDTASDFKYTNNDQPLDGLTVLSSTNSSLCAGAASRNRAAYNPTITYDPPVNADGNSFANAIFNGAWRDGFNTGLGTVNLSNLGNIGSNAAGRRLIPPETWTSNGGFFGTTKITSFFYYATPDSGSVSCVRSASGYNPSNFSIVTTSSNIDAPDVARGSAAALTNYANWFSYYRTRIVTMRSAAGKAFADIDATRFRVGFMTINERVQTSDTADFLHARDFSAGSQKANFFSRLYSVAASGGTPLRLALSTAGAYFANKVPGQTYDPVQYSCQRNYAILTTDGYWNGAGGQKLTSSGNYTAMQNEDGPSSGAARPYLDDTRSSGTSTGGSGYGDTLSDAAYFYYKTDLRSAALGNCGGSILGEDVCTNNVTAIANDAATYQHMNTFTLGLGVAGDLTYDPNYMDQAAGSFADIRNGVRTWPKPVADSASAVDDLWHAAVNGRGFFYSASDPAELAQTLANALTTISVANGSGAGAGTSSLRPVAGDNKVFIAKYTSGSWNGEMESYDLNPSTGAVVNPSAPTWRAGELLRTRNLGTSPRNIYVFNSGATNKLRSFTYANLSVPQQAFFNGLCTAPAKLAQCGGLNSNALAKVTGANVVSFLSGETQYELAAGSPDNRLFRTRVTPLGDFGNASPVYVKKPPFRYVDGGYAAFATANVGRAPMVYAAANDGMLHAFNALTGQEVWAYVPSMVLPEMYRLADRDYAAGTNHRYFVDATPTIADVYDSALAQWRTVLVGGLGAGGKGYYALDVTDPANPKGLWEFTDTNLGLTYGNPVVTKLKNGTWAVMLGSGYNNDSGGADGNGRIYIRNVLTGAQISAPVVTYTAGTTPAGTVATPNNLGKLNAWVDDSSNNTAKRVYAGDLLGNMWRFDVDDNLGPAGNEALLLGIARSSSAGNPPQPITSQPQLSELIVNSGKVSLVAFGTGRLLGQNDLNNADVQSLYVIKDELLTTSAGNLRTNPTMVQQTMSAANTIPNPLPIDWASKLGWFVDFSINAKERIIVDPDQQGSSLTVVSAIPSPTACSPGGSSRLYSFSIQSGLTTRSVLYDRLIVGLSNILLLDGDGQSTQPASLLTTDDGQLITSTETNAAVATPPIPRRSAWRELIN